MFNSTKYTRLYYRLIELYGDSNLKIGENHHVIPKSLGGPNEKSNIVRVPPRVHFILHKCLVRMIDDKKLKYKMQYAMWRMMKKTKMNHRSYTVTSTEYELAKNAIRFYMREHNPMFRKEVSEKFKRKRPEQSAVAIARNAAYWTDENKHKRLVQNLERAKSSGKIYELTNVQTSEVEHFFILSNVKKFKKLKSINPGVLCQKTFMLKRVRIDSVAKFNPQDSDYLTFLGD